MNKSNYFLINCYQDSFSRVHPPRAHSIKAWISSLLQTQNTVATGWIIGSCKRTKTKLNLGISDNKFSFFHDACGRKFMISF